jgi:hypothetical protein
VTPIDPGQALLPGPGDAHRLLWLWIVRRATFGVVLLGLVVGMVVSGAAEEGAELEIDTSSAESVLRGIVTRFGLVFAAIVLRLLVNWVALALAYPLARAHQGPVEPHPGLRRRIAIHSDRFTIDRAYRELRWTEGVRAAALARLGPASRRYEQLDRAVGVANAVLVGACVVAFFAVGLTVEA